MKRAREQPDGSTESPKSPSRTTLLGLDWLNFLLADVRPGWGHPCIYLAGYKWNESGSGWRSRSRDRGILTQTAGRRTWLTFFDRSELW